MIEEFIIVLTHSKRTQLALLLAVLCPPAIWMLGQHLVETLKFPGALAPYANVLRDKLEHRYEKVAFWSLLVFLGLFIKTYFKARKRLFQL